MPAQPRVLREACPYDSFFPQTVRKKRLEIKPRIPKTQAIRTMTDKLTAGSQSVKREQGGFRQAALRIDYDGAVQDRLQTVVRTSATAAAGVRCNAGQQGLRITYHVHEPLHTHRRRSSIAASRSTGRRPWRDSRASKLLPLKSRWRDTDCRP